MKVVEHMRSRARTTAVRVLERAPAVTSAIVHRFGSPTLLDLSQAAASWHCAPVSMLEAIFEVPEEVALVAVEDAAHAVDRVSGRVTQRPMRYPSFFRVEAASAQLLHAAVRIHKPDIVLETGVADGLSTALILDAMESNGRGELHSIDIDHDIGAFVADRRRWVPHVVREDNPEDFVRVVGTVGPLDMFLHDANHDFAHQRFEYETVWPLVKPGGVFMSDDADASYAFLDFARQHALTSAMLLDSRKVFAAAWCRE
jgi:predicted O-methyltransferase YrrM